MWRSATSWLHWSLARPQRALQERRQRLALERAQELRQVLLEALTPLAEALQRQDQQSQQQHLWLAGQLSLLEDLLKEALGSLQPPASQQIQEMLDQKPPLSFPRSGS